MIRDLDKTILGDTRQGGLGKKYEDESLREGTECVKIFVSHVTGHQKTSIAEEVLSNQENKLTWCVDVIRSLPSYPSAYSVSPRTKWPWWPEWRLPLTKADLASTLVECLICQHQRLTLSPLMCQYSPEGPVTWYRLITLVSSLHGGGMDLFSLK